MGRSPLHNALISTVLVGFLAFRFFADEFINFDRDLDDLPASSIPTIVITPPTEDHATNLPPPYREQDPNLLMAIPRSRRTKRRSSSSRSKSRSRKGGR
ncbi:hypothetical protein DFH28DRAFT_1129743 [Melampsora americana]|nr:hypothetical protein DFH28DRAFT_1129743 [Melampsora americana]